MSDLPHGVRPFARFPSAAIFDPNLSNGHRVTLAYVLMRIFGEESGFVLSGSEIARDLGCKLTKKRTNNGDRYRSDQVEMHLRDLCACGYLRRELASKGGAFRYWPVDVIEPEAGSKQDIYVRGVWASVEDRRVDPGREKSAGCESSTKGRAKVADPGRKKPASPAEKNRPPRPNEIGRTRPKKTGPSGDQGSDQREDHESTRARARAESASALRLNQLNGTACSVRVAFGRFAASVEKPWRPNMIVNAKCARAGSVLTEMAALNGRSIEDVIEAAIDGFRKSSYARSEGYPFDLFVSDPCRWVEQERTPRIGHEDTECNGVTVTPFSERGPGEDLFDPGLARGGF